MSSRTERGRKPNSKLRSRVPAPFVEVTDLGGGRARVRLDLVLAWPDVLNLLEEIRLAGVGQRDWPRQAR